MLHNGVKNIKYVILIVIAVLGTLINVSFPYLTGTLVDELIIDKELSNIFKIIVVLVFLRLIIMLLNFSSAKLCFDVMSHDFIQMTTRKIMSYLDDVAYYKIDYQKNKLTQLLLEDIGTISRFKRDDLIEIVKTSISLSIYLIYIYFMNKLVFIACVISIPLFSLLYIKNKEKLSNISKKNSLANNYMFNSLDTIICNSFTINSLCLNSSVPHEIENVYSKVRSWKLESIMNSFRVKIAENFMSSCIVMLTCISSGMLIVSNKISVGDFTVLLSYSSATINTLSVLLNYSRTYTKYKVSKNRYLKLCPQASVEDDFIIYSWKIENIYLHQIRLFVDDRILIENLSYVFKKNKIYGICGDNGVGKSTLINSIVGMYNDYHGDIRYNNYSLNELSRKALRRHKVLYISQEFAIDVFSLFESNLITKNYTRQISNLSSGGEKKKQILDIIDSRKFEVLVLDEPTSSLDTIEIEAFKRKILKYKQDSIIIIATHNDNILNFCDEIINLNFYKMNVK